MPNPTSSPVATLFVYGTLMRMTGQPMARKLHGQSGYLGPAWIRGKLYSLGRYPGLVLSEVGPDRVHGEVVRLANPARCFDWIDAYEGCSRADPEPHEYERLIVPVTLQSGARLDAWVYVYKKPVSRARQIPDGLFYPF
jgi:gamma-glutamylcyclotransferase (GGCT)/AIG2-like uncharacterized protein YtfP